MARKGGLNIACSARGIIPLKTSPTDGLPLKTMPLRGIPVGPTSILLASKSPTTKLGWDRKENATAQL
jgi:hypothetical protein